jgi:hypothetical protein
VALTALLTVLSGCVSLSDRTLSGVSGHWRHGSKDRAIALAGGEVERYIEGNELTLAQVERAARSALEALEEAPLVDGRATRTPTPADLLARGPFELARELRADLRSGSSLAVLRALHTVRSLRLKRYALDVLAVIYRPEPYGPGGALWGDTPRPLRSVAIKWVAHETLKNLAL